MGRVCVSREGGRGGVVGARVMGNPVRGIEGE